MGYVHKGQGQGRARNYSIGLYKGYYRGPGAGFCTGSRSL